MRMNRAPQLTTSITIIQNPRQQHQSTRKHSNTPTALDLTKKKQKTVRKFFFLGGGMQNDVLAQCRNHIKFREQE